MWIRGNWAEEDPPSAVPHGLPILVFGDLGVRVARRRCRFDRRGRLGPRFRSRYLRGFGLRANSISLVHLDIRGRQLELLDLVVLRDRSRARGFVDQRVEPGDVLGGLPVGLRLRVVLGRVVS